MEEDDHEVSLYEVLDLSSFGEKFFLGDNKLFVLKEAVF